MKLPGKDFLKKAFLVAATGVGLASMTGCAIVPGPHGRLMVEPVIPVAPVVVEPYYQPYYYPQPSVIVVPGRPYYHHGYGHRW